RDPFCRPSPPPHLSGLGGCSRLDHRLCRRLRSAAFSPVSASDPGGFKNEGRQEFEMYTPPLFKQDHAASLKFAEERGFGTICAWNGTRPIASLLPFYLSHAADGTTQVFFPLPRHNPLLKLADGASSWL